MSLADGWMGWMNVKRQRGVKGCRKRRVRKMERIEGRSFMPVQVWARQWLRWGAGEKMSQRCINVHVGKGIRLLGEPYVEIKEDVHRFAITVQVFSPQLLKRVWECVIYWVLCMWEKMRNLVGRAFGDIVTTQKRIIFIKQDRRRLWEQER